MRTDELVQRLAADLKPVRRLRGVGWRTLLWAVFALSCVAIGVWALGARADLPWKVRDPFYLLKNALLLSIFAASARSAFLLSVPGAERSVAARALPMAGLLLWVCLNAAGASTEPLPLASPGFPCVLRMAALALPPAVAILLALRRAAPLSPGWTGWFALLSAASLAMLGTQFVCAKDDPLHLFLWHFGPVLAAALIGSWGHPLRRPSDVRTSGRVSPFT